MTLISQNNSKSISLYSTSVLLSGRKPLVVTPAPNAEVAESRFAQND
jgi:hypothetical protein